MPRHRMVIVDFVQRGRPGFKMGLVLILSQGEEHILQPVEVERWYADSFARSRRFVQSCGIVS